VSEAPVNSTPRQPLRIPPLIWKGSLVFLLALFPYLGVLRAPFVFDDVKLVKENESIRDLGKILQIFNIFSKEWDDQELRANYRPFRFLSYAVDYRISRWIYGDFEPDSVPATVFHVHNILLHGLNALLLLGIGRILLRDGRAALVLACLFALHPIMTEAVTYISGRRDVLSTFLFLAALRIYLGKATADGAAPVSIAALILVPILFILGFLSKEMVVTLPAVLLLIDLARRARFDGRRILLLGSLWILAILFTTLEASNPRLVAGAVGGSPASTLLTAPRYVIRYLGLLLFPHSQSIDYSYDAIPVSGGILDPWTTPLAALLLLALVGAGLYALARGRFALSVGLLWFVGTLTPVLQLVPIPERFAERFLYLPSIGIFLVAAALFRASSRRGMIPAACVAVPVLFLLGALTVLRNGDWSSPERLWGSAARAQPRCARAHLGHGHELRKSGRLRDAARAYDRCLEILGDSPPEAILRGEPEKARSDELLRWGQVLHARASRAQVYGELGAESSENYRQAVEDYRWLFLQRDTDGAPIASSPQFVPHRYNLANSLLGLYQSERDPERATELRSESAREFRRVIEMGGDPFFTRWSHYYLSKIALKEGKKEEGLQELETAAGEARESGNVMEYYRLAWQLLDLLMADKNYDRADEVLEAAIGELRGLPVEKHLLYRRSRLHDLRGDLVGAIRSLEDALELDPRYAPALLTLADMEEKRGNLDRAEELYVRLLKVQPDEKRALDGIRSIDIRRKMASEKGGGPDGGPPADKKTGMQLEGLLQRGEDFLKKGSLFAAADLFHQALKLIEVKSSHPKSFAREKGHALRRLGHISRELKKYQEAEQYLTLAIAADPSSGEALLEMADLQLQHLGNRQRAEEAYQAYLDLLPQGELGESRAYINLGGLLEKSRPDRAIQLLQKARKAGFPDPTVERRVLCKLGYLLAGEGRWEESLDHLEEFLEKSQKEAGAAEEAERRRVNSFLLEEVLPNVEGGEALRDRKASGR